MSKMGRAMSRREPEPLQDVMEPQYDSADEMEEKFAAMQNQSEMSEVLKELFDPKKLFMIADMSKDEIKLATRIYMIADMKGIQIWKDGLEFYARFLISKDRKSRKEILQAIQGYHQPQGLMGKIGGVFNGGNRGF